MVSGDKTVAQGAATPVFCAVNDTLEGGAYYVDCACSATPSAAHGVDPQMAQKLWAAAEFMAKRILYKDHGPALRIAVIGPPGGRSTEVCSRPPI